jgi:hypothetical protein
MNLNPASVLLKTVSVSTTSERGHTPEELAELFVNKIIQVGNSSHPVIRDQAIAFRESVKQLAIIYLREAVVQDRATLAHRMKKAGQPDLVNFLGD